MEAQQGLGVGTVGKGFYRYQPDKGSFDSSYFHLADGLEVMDFAEDGADTLYVATSQGLLKISIKNRKLLQHFQAGCGEKGPIANRIFGMKKSSENQLWMATVSGLSIFDLKTKTFENYSESPFDRWGIQEKRLISLHLDKKGLAWIGSWNKGIYSTSVSGLGFHNLRTKPDQKEKQSFSEIMDIQACKPNKIWITTESDGLVRFDFKTKALDFYSPN